MAWVHLAADAGVTSPLLQVQDGVADRVDGAFGDDQAEIPFPDGGKPQALVPALGKAGTATWP
ncbi:MAG: hypothetical protein GY731_11815 [Gammaproteobacteria bacterium]|nr:hypothetical protein [Gammaproteobacteria bacterium]